MSLKSLAGKKYKVLKDECGDEYVPCRHGQLYLHSSTALGAQSLGNKRRAGLFASLAQAQGWQVTQRGDTEVTALVPVDQLDAVARYLRARRKRRLAQVHRDALVARLAAYRFRAASPGATP